MSELIKQQYTRTRTTLAKALEGTSPEIFDIIPEGFNNNIHWQVGHILTTGALFMFHGQQVLPENYNALFGNSTKPADWTGDVPSVETLLAQLEEQLEQINKIDVSTFDQRLDQPFIGNETIGELAAMGAFHEAYHVGQVHILKRLIEASR